MGIKKNGNLFSRLEREQKANYNVYQLNNCSAIILYRGAYNQNCRNLFLVLFMPIPVSASVIGGICSPSNFIGIGISSPGEHRLSGDSNPESPDSKGHRRLANPYIWRLNVHGVHIFGNICSMNPWFTMIPDQLHHFASWCNHGKAARVKNLQLC